MEAGWGRRRPQNASRRRRRKSGSAHPTPSRSPGTDEAGAGRRLRATAGPAASPRPRDALGKGPAGSRGGRQWLTWEVIMMLESIRKLMVKCRASSRLHLPLPRPQHARDAGPLTLVAFARGPPPRPLLASPTPSSCVPATQSAATSGASLLGLGAGGTQSAGERRPRGGAGRDAIVGRGLSGGRLAERGGVRR